MNAECPVVFVLDDDPSVREALSSLLRSAGLQVSVFESAAEFLQAKKRDSPPAWSWTCNCQTSVAWSYSGNSPREMDRLSSLSPVMGTSLRRCEP